MPSTTERLGPPFLRRATSILREEGEGGFVVRFTALIAALLIVPWLISLADLTGPARYAVPASAALILAGTYIRRPAEALLAFALFLLFHDTIALRVGSSIRQLDEAAVGLLFLIGLARAWRSWRKWLWLPRDATLAAAFGVGMISSLAANVPITIWVPALALAAKGIAFLYTVIWTEIRGWELRAGMRIVLAVGAAILALGVIELVNPPAFQRSLGLHEYVRSRGEQLVVKSLFFHPVLFAWFTAFVGLFVHAQFLVTRQWRWLFVAVAFTFGPFMAARRRAILALFAGLGAAFLESLRRTRSPRELVRAWGPVVLGAGLVVAIFWSGLVSLYDLTVERYLPDEQPPAVEEPGGEPGSEEAGENPQARAALYIGSVEIARDYFPLGGGLGRYASWMTRLDYSPLYTEYGLDEIHGLRPSNPRFATDTFWPQILGEFGALGLIAYVGFFGSLVYLLWREAGLRDGGTTLRVLRLGAGMIFAQALVESLASPMFHSPPRVYLAYLVVGIVISTAWRRTPPAPATRGG